RIAVSQLLPAPTTLPDPLVESLPLQQLQLLPPIAWDREFSEQWTPGEAGAQDALDVFADDAARGYLDGRNRPDQQGTSRLSPHLHFGEISPRQIIHQLVGPDISATNPNSAWE